MELMIFVIKMAISAHDARTARQVRPCVYLKSDVMLSGSGTEDDPYVIVK